MEPKEAKSALNQLWHIERRIVEIQQRIESARSRAMKATASFNAVNASGTSARSKVEAGVIQAIDLERQLSRTLVALTDKRFRIQDAINGMENEQEKRLIELRYIDRLSWNAITYRLAISRTQSFRLHENALKHFADAYKGGQG